MRGPVAPLFALAVLAGCAGGGDNPAAVPGSQDQVVDGAARTEASAALDAALKPLLDERITGFQAFGHVGKMLGYTINGAADSGTPGWSVLAYVYKPGRSPAEARLLDALSVDGKVWMSFRDWPKDQQGCWLAMGTPTERPFGFAALQPTEPAYISVLGDLEPVGFSNVEQTLLDADLNLQSVMGLQTAQLFKALGIAGMDLSGQRVPVQVVIGEGRLRELRIDGAAIRAGLEAAGVAMEPDVADAVGLLRVDVSYVAGEEDAPKIKAPKAVVGAGRCKAATVQNPVGA